MSKRNDTGFIPAKNRHYLSLQPRNEEEELKLIEKLNIRQQLIELSAKTAQKWAAQSGAETYDTITIRIYDYGKMHVGIALTVSAIGTDCDRYAAYLLPTIKDGYVLQVDFAEIAEESRFVASMPQ